MTIFLSSFWGGGQILNERTTGLGGRKEWSLLILTEPPGPPSTAWPTSPIRSNVIYCYVKWTNNRGTVPEANTRRQEGKYLTIKILRGCLLKLSLYLVNSVLILYRTGNMQFAILLSLVASSSLLPCELQSTHPPMSCYISPYIAYNVYDDNSATHLSTSIVNQWLVSKQLVALPILLFFSHRNNLF